MDKTKYYIKMINNNKLNHSGYFIKYNKLSEKEINNITNDLTIINKEIPENNFNIYQETINRKKLVVPRYYGIKKWGIPSIINFKINDIDKINIKFNGSLRNYQIDIVNTIKKNLYNNDKLLDYGGGILCIPPGRGKTVIGLYIASLLQYKTLVIVNKDFLLEQWKERIEAYTDAKVGIIQRDNIDICNKDIVIGMLQSISMKDYDNEIFRSFPFVIFDECHHLAAKTFSKALTKIQSPYMLGLSATPNRKDKLEYVFNYYLGDIIYKEDIKPNDKVIVNIYNFTIIHKKFKMLVNRYSKFSINIAGMTNNLVEIDERNNYIISIIKNLLIKESKRKILILSGRVSHCQKLLDIFKLDSNYIDDIGLYIGGMKKNQLKISEEKKLIFGTYEMAQEALDIQDLDTLVLATPLKGNINQTIGRILRKEVKNYINPPKIIDIVDNIKYFENCGRNRLDYYISNEYNIEFYKHDDNYKTNISDAYIKPTNNLNEYDFDE